VGRAASPFYYQLTDPDSPTMSHLYQVPPLVVRQRLAHEAPLAVAQRRQQQHRLPWVHLSKQARHGGRVHGREECRLVLGNCEHRRPRCVSALAALCI
jgi:hypothetical protein